MTFLTYVRLIGFTAGTLLQLFWMVVILGYRRQRNFERVFFFLCLALFFFYGGSLLALNAQIYYAEPPLLLRAFAVATLCTGLCFLPPLLVHLHIEYAETRELLRSRTIKRTILLTAYAPTLYFALHAWPILAHSSGFDFLIPGNALGRGYGVWLGASMLLSGGWEVQFRRRAPDGPQRVFHGVLAALFAAGAVMTVYLHVLGRHLSPESSAGLSAALAFLAILPYAALIYLVQRFNFLQIGRQKNLVYAVSATFLALLYLSLVRRVGVWLEPVLPPEASASILLFVLVIFIEPLQRVLGRRLQETTQKEMDMAHRLATRIQEEARRGDVSHLADFIESSLRDQFEFADAGLMLWHPSSGKEERFPSRKNFREGFSILQGNRTIGTLWIEPHGAATSGETRAALEFLCEQLPGALDLCRLIEEKVQLERELAERERMAALGQMAASISHNLKNPLGSMKTILQVQLESPELPDAMRSETRLVLEEIERLSAKLNQLLRFSRPAVRNGQGAASCGAREAVEAATSVLRLEAERRGVRLRTDATNESLRVAASEEVMNEILSNLVVNALEAAQGGGHVTLNAAGNGDGIEFTVEDDGPGIPETARERLLQPFFTTKAQGTGLGLAIVARRVEEFGGRLEWESPVANGRGTRFRVCMPRVK